MKFISYDCLKHKNGIDAFIYILNVVQDTGQVAIVNAVWIVQGIESHWATGRRQRIVIKRDQYKNWQPVEPRGSLL